LERLVDGEADLILHHLDKADPRLEFIDLFAVKIVPVVAPNFLRFPISKSITPEAMRDYVQCVIRDCARHSRPRDYYLLEGAWSWTVSDQLMKRELILQGMGWGHMPRYLIERDLGDKRLLPITGKHFRGGEVELVAARLRNAPRSPIASRLRQFIGDQGGEDRARELGLRPRRDAAGRDLGFAGGLATRGRLTAVDAAGQAVDQPGTVLGRTFDSDIAVAERGHQGGEQDRRRNHRCADQYRHRAHQNRPVRSAGAIPQVFILSLDGRKHGTCFVVLAFLLGLVLIFVDEPPW